MTGTLNHLGLASSDGISAKSTSLGAVVRSRLAGAAVGDRLVQGLRSGVAAIGIMALTFVAAPANAQETIGACFGNKSGDLRIAGSAADCQKKETFIVLSIQGPQGEQGIPGIQGPPGPAGTDGEDGTDGVDGTDGTDGTDGVDGSDADVTVLQAQIDDLQAQIDSFHPKTVFVTSTIQHGDLGGIAGADGICQDRANAAALPGEYKAWLATNDNDDPESTFTRPSRGYVLTNGDVVADDWDDLTDGSLQHPINITEFGVLDGRGLFAWTNVRDTGVVAGEFVEDSCTNWTSSVHDDVAQGRTGFPHFFDAGWSDAGQDPCDILQKLYCFGQ